MAYILILLIGSMPVRGVALTAIPGFSDRGECESAGEAWKIYAKAEHAARYYCIPGRPHS